MKANNITRLIGKTPLVRLLEIEKHFGLEAELYAKLEKSNPSGSVKDRAALFIIKKAFEKKLISKGGTVIEPTSGNMGISLSMLSSVLGYNAVMVMPENMTRERVEMIKAYGGRVVLSESEGGMRGAMDMAEKLVAEHTAAYMPSQFTNRQNLLAHYFTTGPEIYRQLSGRLDFLVCGVGSGGTIGGAGLFLKEKIPTLKVVAVEPQESCVLSGGKAGTHRIFGIGAGFVPPLADLNNIDMITSVSSEEVAEYKRLLSAKEGLFVGVSSGAALCAGVRIAGKKENRSGRIVMVFPDGGEKYLSASW